MEQINILNQSSAILLILIVSIIFVLLGVFYTKKYHHMLRWMSAINQSIPFRERNVQEEWIKFYNKRKKGDEV